MKDENKVRLVFENKGAAGAVYHVYDMNHLQKIPRRYTVEAGKTLSDEWDTAANNGLYDLEVYGPNGYFHKFTGNIQNHEPKVKLAYDHVKGSISAALHNPTGHTVDITIISNAYQYEDKDPWLIKLKAGKRKSKSWDLKNSGNWYDFSIKTEDGFLHRFAGRVETQRHSISDPAMAMDI